MFRIGQKVVCVWDTFIDPPWKEVKRKPVKGDVYTVRGLQQEIHFSGILLEEIHNEPCNWQIIGTREMSFPALRFRPVVERKTDISIFTAMLTPSPVTVDAMNVADHAREIVG